VSQLLQRAEASEATATLYDRHHRRVRGYCLGQLRNREEADDATQSTFLYAFAALRRGVAPRNELAWLFAIAHNVCRTRQRSLRRRSRVESGVDFDTLRDTVGRNDPSRDELDGLGSSLAALPENQRRALLLREWQGLSYAEVAARMGLTESAVEAVLFRARRSLAQKLKAADRVASLVGAGFVFRNLRRFGSLTGTGKAAVGAVALGLAAGAVVQPVFHSARNAPPTRSAAARPTPRAAASPGVGAAVAAAATVPAEPRAHRLRPSTHALVTRRAAIRIAPTAHPESRTSPSPPAAQPAGDAPAPANAHAGSVTAVTAPPVTAPRADAAAPAAAESHAIVPASKPDLPARPVEQVRAKAPPVKKLLPTVVRKVRLILAPPKPPSANGPQAASVLPPAVQNVVQDLTSSGSPGSGQQPPNLLPPVVQNLVQNLTSPGSPSGNSQEAPSLLPPAVQNVVQDLTSSLPPSGTSPPAPASPDTGSPPPPPPLLGVLPADNRSHGSP